MVPVQKRWKTQKGPGRTWAGEAVMTVYDTLQHELRDPGWPPNMGNISDGDSFVDLFPDIVKNSSGESLPLINI